MQISLGLSSVFEAADFDIRFRLLARGSGGGGVGGGGGGVKLHHTDSPVTTDCKCHCLLSR